MIRSGPDNPHRKSGTRHADISNSDQTPDIPPSFSAHELSKIRDLTPGTKSVNHLLACGASLMSEPVISAVTNHLRLEATEGGYRAHTIEQAKLDSLYQKAADLVGARDSAEIAVTENSTMAWAMAFYSLGLRRGDRVLTCQAEYSANYVAMLQLAERLSIKIEVVPNDESGQVDLNILEAMVNEKTRLIAMTWIPTDGGLINPVHEIGEIAERYNLLFLVDACQAVGQLPVNVLDIGCDILSTTGRKWLRGPRGIGLLYVRKSLIEQMEPIIIDHFSAQLVDETSYELREDARRFETWENAYALRSGLVAAIDYANELGIERISKRTMALASRLREGLVQIDGVKLHDLGRQQCAIITFTVDGVDSKEVVDMAQQRSIVIGQVTPADWRLDQRDLPSMVRCAPHYYNSEAEIDALLELILHISSTQRMP